MNSEDRLHEMRSILSVITAWFVLPLYAAFWLVDCYYQPEAKWVLLGIRMIILPIAILVHILNRKAKSFRMLERVALFYVFVNGLLITLIILYIGVPNSPYYAGLALVAIASLGFVPWGPRYFVYTVISIFFPYYLVEWYLFTEQASMVLLVINTAFIISVIMVTAVIRVFREHLRKQDNEVRKELEKEIEHRKGIEKKLIEARDLAMSATIAKSNFISNMSHEMRTPLNAVIGYGELLYESLQEKGMDELLPDVDKINRSGKHLVELVNNVLDMSKIEAGKMEVNCTHFLVADLASNLVNLLQAIAKNNHNTISVDISENAGIMYSDEIKVRQILFNLLSNAIKFTREGKVFLNIKPESDQGTDGLKFIVEDEGTGIEEEKLGVIFDSFTQADSGITRNYGGTGLGLSITQRFSNLLGGSITVQSQIGKGSSFTVWLPRQCVFVKDESV